MDFAKDDIFDGRYRIIKAIGEGGFSKIWLTEDLRTHLKVALKIYNGLDEEGIKDFRNEFTIVFGMANPYLLRPQSFDVYDETIPYLVMPYCSQGSIYRNTGQMPESKIWKLLHDVASGLAYLHEQAIPVVHQDIKPRNILLSDTGDYLITDFGISMTIRNTFRRSAITPVAGTMAYMAPERFSADPTPIIASDIWSLGATLFEIMTGNAPFDDLGGAKQNAGAAMPIINQHFSKELKSYVAACLQKDPWDRPTAAKLADVAKSWLDGGIVGMSNTLKPVWWKRSYFLVTATAAIALIVILLGLSQTDILNRGKSPDNALISQVEKSKAEEEERLRLEEEARQKKDAEEERLRLAEEALKKKEAEEEAELKRLANEALKKKEADAAAERRRLEDEALKKKEANASAERKRLADDARKKKEADAAAERRRLADEARKKKEADADAERRRLEEEARKKKEADAAAESRRLEEIKTRLASYETFGRFGSYNVAQKKSTLQWGVIDSQGNEFIPCRFREFTLNNLRSGYIGLRNGNTWDVYDSSGRRVDSGLSNLTKYQK